MRIVGGRLSGRRFESPKGSTTRPATDRVREAVGSLLDARGRIDGASVLDLFAGSGAYSFELLSRGAASAVAVDRDKRAQQAMKKNAGALGLALTVMGVDLFGRPERAVTSLVQRGPFDLVVADPPYADAQKLGPLLHALMPAMAEGATVIVEHASKAALGPLSPLEEESSYRYGDSSILLLRGNLANKEDCV